MYDLRSSPMILAPSACFLTEFPFSLICLPGHSKGPGEKEIKALVSNFALGEPRRLLPSPRPPRPGGGGVPLEEEAAKLSLGKDPTEKGSGEIMDDSGRRRRRRGQVARGSQHSERPAARCEEKGTAFVEVISSSHFE